MTNWESLQPYLPSEWLEALRALPPEVADRVQEVRVRVEQPLAVSLPEGERYVLRGGVTTVRQQGLLFCSHRQLEMCFLRFCDHSVYAHEWELRQGYLAVRGGIRVGVAGTAVTRKGEIASVQSVTALCIRLPRCMRGCADGLNQLVSAPGYLISTLLVGEPSSGKTTLLRDLALHLSAEHYRVTVVDERGELTGPAGLPGCDVLLGYPKAEGVQQAIRCLAPDVVLFDELGSETEAAAVAACAHAGVAVVATLHGHRVQEMVWRPLPRLLLEQRGFGQWVFLSGRQRPGHYQNVYRPEVNEDGVDWRPVDFYGRDRDGGVCLTAVASKSRVFTTDLPPVANLVAANRLYGSADEGFVESFGSNACVL